MAGQRRHAMKQVRHDRLRQETAQAVEREQKRSRVILDTGRFAADRPSPGPQRGGQYRLQNMADKVGKEAAATDLHGVTSRAGRTGIAGCAGGWARASSTPLTVNR